MTTLDRGARIQDGTITGIRTAMQALLQEKIAELAELAAIITALELKIRETPDEFSLPTERYHTWEQ